MKEIVKSDSEDFPLDNQEEYDKNLEQMAISIITKGSIEHKVKDFKARVYGLLLLYLSKVKSPKTLIKSLAPVLTDIQPTDVPKLDALIRQALKKSMTIPAEDIQVLVEHYIRLLLKTARWKDSKRITETFTIILRSLIQHGKSQQDVKGIIIALSEKYIYKRGVKIHPESLQHLVKRFKFSREAFIDSLNKALNSEALREAMKKQVRKMLRWFGKGSEIKVE